MAGWECAACGAQWAPGAPRCPECPSTKHREVDEVPKINRAGVVTFEADARLAGAEASLAALDATVAVEHPADGTMSPEVGNDGPGEPEPVAGDAPVPEPAPKAPPRTPPRRTPPGGGQGG